MIFYIGGEEEEEIKMKIGKGNLLLNFKHARLRSFDLFFS